MLNFSVCSKDKYKNNNDEWVERSEWHNCVMWGKRGEALHKYLKKGSKCFIEGQIRTRSWEKDGVKKYATEINVLDIDIDIPKQQSYTDERVPRQQTFEHAPSSSPAF